MKPMKQDKHGQQDQGDDDQQEAHGVSASNVGDTPMVWQGYLWQFSFELSQTC